MNVKNSDEERQLGTADPLNIREGLQILGEQYQRLPEDFRTGLEEGTAANMEAIRQWNVQKREENYWGGIGPLDPLIGVVNTYNAVVEPAKKELSIRTGLDPINFDAAEIAADVATPFIPLTIKKLDDITDILNPKIWKRRGKDFIKLTPDEAYPNYNPELGGYAFYSKADDVDMRPVRPDPFAEGAPVANPNAPIESWGPNIGLTNREHIDLAEIVYQETLKDSDRLSEVTNYKLGGRASLQKWAREEFMPLMDAAADEQKIQPEAFYSWLATKPRFKYVEHKVAKTKALKWYWEMQGDPSIPWDVKANHVDNLRILLDDRFKKLKDAVEVQVYGGSSGTGGINSTIPVRSERYIVDVQDIKGGKRYLALEHNAGDVVIRRAGSPDEVGRIGAYYKSLFSSHDDLIFGLQKKFPELKDMTRSQQQDWIREWRTKIINDHLDIIRQKEVNLQGLSPREKFDKIEEALNNDMVDFRDEYAGYLPDLNKAEWTQLRADMKAADIMEMKMKNRNTVQIEIKPTGEDILEESIRTGKSKTQAKKGLKPPYKGYTKTLERETTKLKGTGYSSLLNKILKLDE